MPEEAQYGVQYPGPSNHIIFAWFITRNDAKAFADLMKRREDIDYKVVKL